jgi:hypothetical protein
MEDKEAKKEKEFLIELVNFFKDNILWGKIYEDCVWDFTCLQKKAESCGWHFLVDFWTVMVFTKDNNNECIALNKGDNHVIRAGYSFGDKNIYKNIKDKERQDAWINEIMKLKEEEQISKNRKIKLTKKLKRLINRTFVFFDELSFAEHKAIMKFYKLEKGFRKRGIELSVDSTKEWKLLDIQGRLWNKKEFKKWFNERSKNEQQKYET